MNERLFDVVIIGGGPAGLTAALYLARARYRVLVVEKERFGGQITITADVVNYPGVESGSGEAITAVIRQQAQRFGAEFLLAEVQQVELAGQYKKIHTTRGEYSAYGVVVAIGAHPRSIGFKGESDFKGRGVAYCATCDGEFFTGLDVFVVGGGFAAAEEAVFLTQYARRVTVLVREEDFTCAKATADPVKANQKIEIHYNTVVEEVAGETNLQSLRYKNIETGEQGEYTPPSGETFGVFVFAGYEPATELVKGQLQLDDYGYIVTDHNRKTNIEGVYAAGDVCVKNLRQMVTATADGATAATELERYVTAMHVETGEIPTQPATRISQKAGQKQPGTPPLAGFFTEEIRAQLEPVFHKMETPLVLRLYLDKRPVSGELEGFMTELAALTEMLSVETAVDSLEQQDRPCVKVYKNGEYTGIAFHGVPGGHEFNSFVLGLYNAAGPGQALDTEQMEQVQGIRQPVSMKVLVSLSCTMCPELVMAAQRIAAANPLVQAEAYDLNHFPALKEQYKVMSVPCLVLNDKAVSFGKKNVAQLLEFLNGEIQ